LPFNPHAIIDKQSIAAKLKPKRKLSPPLKLGSQEVTLNDRAKTPGMELVRQFELVPFETD
jgi:hypothetical protein